MDTAATVTRTAVTPTATTTNCSTIVAMVGTSRKRLRASRCPGWRRRLRRRLWGYRWQRRQTVMATMATAMTTAVTKCMHQHVFPIEQATNNKSLVHWQLLKPTSEKTGERAGNSQLSRSLWPRSHGKHMYSTHRWHSDKMHTSLAHAAPVHIHTGMRPKPRRREELPVPPLADGLSPGGPTGDCPTTAEGPRRSCGDIG